MRPQSRSLPDQAAGPPSALSQQAFEEDLGWDGHSAPLAHRHDPADVGRTTTDHRRRRVLDLATSDPAPASTSPSFAWRMTAAPGCSQSCRPMRMAPFGTPRGRRAHRGGLSARLRRGATRRPRRLLPERGGRPAHHRRGALVPRPAPAQPVRHEHLPRQLTDDDDRGDRRGRCRRIVATLSPLFKGAAASCDAGRGTPVRDQDDLFAAARATAREIPRRSRSSCSTRSARRRRSGDGFPALACRAGLGRASRDDQAWVGDELQALNEAYESLFGFRSSCSSPFARAPRSFRSSRGRATATDKELRRGLDESCSSHRSGWTYCAVRARYARSCARQSRWKFAFMVGGLDRHGLVRATHRLMEEGVESPALLALSLINQDRTTTHRGRSAA